MRLLIVSAFLEAVNSNIKSCGYLLNEIGRNIQNNILEESEICLFSFTVAFLKGEKSKFEDVSIDWSKLPKDSSNKFKDYTKIIYNLKKKSDKEGNFNFINFNKIFNPL